MEKNAIRLDELRSDHPLRQHPLEATGVGVPEGYFDQLPTRIQARVVPARPSAARPSAARPSAARPDSVLSWSWRRTVATLAGAGLVAALVWITLPPRQESLGEEALSGVSDAAIASYLDEQGVNPYDLTDRPLDKELSQDSTLIQFLDVTPDAIRRHLETQSASQPVTGS